MPALYRVYERAPVPLQNLACSLAGWWTGRTRFGRTFDDALAAARGRERLSAEAVAAVRDERLRAFVAHCAATVPYWRRRFAELGIDPRDVRTLADLGRLPVLAKDEVRAHREALFSTAWPRWRCVRRGTGGTTGASLRFRAAPAAVSEQWAVWWRCWGWHGIEPGTWCAYFVGADIVPGRQRTAPFWRVNRPRQQVMFSIFHLRPDTLPAYVDELRRRRLPWIHGYPSVLAILARHLLETGTDLGYRPHWVTTAAENLLPHQADLLERGLGVRPRQHYGLAEGAANLSECEHGRLHVDEDFAAVEVGPGAAATGALRLVGTNLSNPAFCLLRYDTGDLVVPDPATACACGRPGRLVASIDGRREDTIILGDGTRLGRLAHIFQQVDCLREAQVRQRRPGEVTIRLVPAPGFGPADEAAVLAAARRRLGPSTAIVIERVAAIERGRNGKLRFVVSELDRPLDRAPAIDTEQPEELRRGE